jgi:WD40 repeat protein
MAEFTWFETGSRLEAYVHSVLSHDGQWLARLEDDTLHLQNLSGLEQTLPLYLEDGGNPLLAFSPDSHLLAASNTWTGAVDVVDVESGAVVQRMDNLDWRPQRFSWNDAYLAATCAWGVALWSTGDWQLTPIRLPDDAPGLNDAGVELGGERIVVWDRPYPGYGDYTGFSLYTASFGDTSLQQLVDIELPDVRDAALSPDERYLAAGMSSGEIPMFDLESGEVIDRLETRQGSANYVRFDTAGSLVVGAESGLVQVWTPQ